MLKRIVVSATAILAGIVVCLQPAFSADFSGVWMATSPRSAAGANVPELTERAQADFDTLDPLDDPALRCVMPGFPRAGLIIYPFQIVQTEDLIVFLYESFGMVRRIYMDGREFPEYLPPARTGYSTGYWDGDELVVHTSQVTPGGVSFDGIPHYGDVSVVERYRLANEGQGLEADVTITAPQTFTTPWVRSFTWELDPDGMIFESVCDPSDSRF